MVSANFVFKGEDVIIFGENKEDLFRKINEEGFNIPEYQIEINEEVNEDDVDIWSYI